MKKISTHAGLAAILIAAAPGVLSALQNAGLHVNVEATAIVGVVASFVAYIAEPPSSAKTTSAQTAELETKLVELAADMAKLKATQSEEATNA
jgi:hypothetical protein